MILAKVYFNTDAQGLLVPEDVELEDMPICYFGPFDDISQAISWMENDWPDDDTDVYEMIADDFKFPKGKEPYVNDPKSIFGDVPDEDIRTEDPSVPPVLP